MPKELRAEFETALAEAADQAGPGSLKVEPVVQAFEGRGASKPTLYRWAAAYKASGAPGQRVARKVKAAAAARAARTPDPALSAAAEVVEKLPVAVTVADIAASPGRSAVSVIERLQETVKAAEQIMRHARTPDAVLAEIRKESPECAERIAMRVGPVAQRWAAEGPPPGR